MVMGIRMLTRSRDCMYVMAKSERRLGLRPRLGPGTIIGSNGDNEIIPCARSRSEIAGADVQRTAPPGRLKFAGLNNR